MPVAGGFAQPDELANVSAAVSAGVLDQIAIRAVVQVVRTRRHLQGADLADAVSRRDEKTYGGLRSANPPYRAIFWPIFL